MENNEVFYYSKFQAFVFILLFILLICAGCKKETPEPDFSIVGAWQSKGVVSMTFYNTGEYNNGTYKWYIQKLTYPHYLINLVPKSQIYKSDKIIIKVLDSDKFEIVDGYQTLERVK
jgi:hypothetical protein